MSELSKLQQQFQAFLTEKNTQVLPLVADAHNESSATRMQIYYNAYRWRLTDVLFEYYPIVHNLLGADDFCEIAEGYIQAHPSKSRSLNDFGDQFSDYLATQLPEYPVLKDMAVFEWTLQTTFTKADAPYVDMTALAALAPESWPNLILQPHPVLSVRTFTTNAGELWQLLKENPEQSVEIQYYDQPEHWAFWRFEYQNYFSSLSYTEWQFVDGLLTEKNFSEICACLLHDLSEEDVPPFALAQIQRWVNARCIQALKDL